ncbi:hypothetical protein [Bacillus sp. V5-8f]|nr:hypothetical protein [Bacillus sp. V5-8f]
MEAENRIAILLGYIGWTGHWIRCSYYGFLCGIRNNACRFERDNSHIRKN